MVDSPATLFSVKEARNEGSLRRPAWRNARIRLFDFRCCTRLLLLLLLSMAIPPDMLAVYIKVVIIRLWYGVSVCGEESKSIGGWDERQQLVLLLERKERIQQPTTTVGQKRDSEAFYTVYIPYTIQRQQIWPNT